MSKQNSIGDGDYLQFEEVIANIDRQMRELQKLGLAKGIDYSTEIRALQRSQVAEFKQIYSNLTAWQTVQVARHPKRPLFYDYIGRMVKDFRELHGDRCFGDDKAIITGIGHIGREKVMIIGQNKGRDTVEKVACNFGCANPEGYRKAMLKMKFAEKFNIPIVTLIDTPGAYPGVGAEERGQAHAIAVNLAKMSRLTVPVICVCIGEGGSGGALGIGVGDRFAILEYAYYSVISPEGCAAILWRDGSEAPQAAEALKLTSGELLNLGLVDAVIKEPLGGAHRNIHDTIYSVERYITSSLAELKRTSMEKRIEIRYAKLRNLGNSVCMPKTASPGTRIKTVRSKPKTPPTSAGRLKART